MTEASRERELTPEYVMNYLRDNFNLKNPEVEIIKNVFNVMKVYDNNFWWELDDLGLIGFYQLFEDRLLVDFDKFHKGIKKLLDRPVWTHEMG